MQKTSAQANDCPQRARTESEWYEGVQTYIWMTEDNVVEVPFDKEHLLEVILSPANLNAAYKCVVRNLCDSSISFGSSALSSSSFVMSLCSSTKS